VLVLVSLRPKLKQVINDIAVGNVLGSSLLTSPTMLARAGSVSVDIQVLSIQFYMNLLANNHLRKSGQASLLLLGC